MLKNLKNRISIRKLHVWLILIIIFTSGVVVVSSYRLTGNFLRLTTAVENHSELSKAAHELMDASDYLTESVQRFTVNGDRQFLDRYFTEAFESNRREEAVLKMSIDETTRPAMERLSAAMENSMDLMNQEYYAMRLVIEAKDITDYPEVLSGITLTEEDRELPPDEKIRRATELVLNDEYYGQKDRIRTEMRESLNEVDKLMNAAKRTELSILDRQLTFIRVVILIQVILIFIMVRMTSIFGVNPVLQAVEKIRDDLPLAEEEGAKEIRYLASAYNRMYRDKKMNIEELNFKASHDELTGAFNRAGYDYLFSNLDLSTAYMILIDLDDFKGINDTYGHETGDRILVKLVGVLRGVFRDDDCICRIGGDEFVVFMMHSSGMSRKLIKSKIEQINLELGKTEDGLPPISISAGVVNGKDADDAEALFKRTDEAMYKSKRQGKHTCTFY